MDYRVGGEGESLLLKRLVYSSEFSSIHPFCSSEKKKKKNCVQPCDKCPVVICEWTLHKAEYRWWAWRFDAFSHLEDHLNHFGSKNKSRGLLAP